MASQCQVTGHRVASKWQVKSKSVAAAPKKKKTASNEEEEEAAGSQFERSSEVVPLSLALFRGFQSTCDHTTRTVLRIAMIAFCLMKQEPTDADTAAKPAPKTKPASKKTAAAKPAPKTTAAAKPAAKRAARKKQKGEPDDKDFSDGTISTTDDDGAPAPPARAPRPRKASKSMLVHCSGETMVRCRTWLRTVIITMLAHSLRVHRTFPLYIANTCDFTSAIR